MKQLQDLGQADALPEVEIILGRASFEEAYEAWREQLCDAALDGLQIADASGDPLFQAAYLTDGQQPRPGQQLGTMFSPNLIAVSLSLVVHLSR